MKYKSFKGGFTMGCLVDFYVITPRDEWLEIITVPNIYNFHRMQNAVPEKYREMFMALLSEYQYLEQIIDNRNRDYFLNVYSTASKYETGDVLFDSRHHKECLLQIIRKTFYKTLFALKDDFNWDKFTYYQVVSSQDIMQEEIDRDEPWEEKRRLAA